MLFKSIISLNQNKISNKSSNVNENDNLIVLTSSNTISQQSKTIFFSRPYFIYLISELKSINIDEVSKSLELIKNELTEIEKQQQQQQNKIQNNDNQKNLDKLDKKLNKSIEEFQHLMVHYGLKTVFSKALKKKVKSVSLQSSSSSPNNNNNSNSDNKEIQTQSSLIIDSNVFINKKPIQSNNNNQQQQQQQQQIRDTLFHLIKLLSLIQMFIIREQLVIQQQQYQKKDNNNDNNDDDDNNLLSIEPILFWVGNSTNLKKELDEQHCKIKIINKSNVQLLITFLKSSKEYLNCPSSYFRIIIDNDIDFKSINQLLNYLKDNNIPNSNSTIHYKIPINIIMNDISSSTVSISTPSINLEYLSLLSLNLPISLSSTSTQFNYFITSMSYKSKLSNNNINNNNKKKSIKNIKNKDEDFDIDDMISNQDQKRQQDEDDQSTDEDSSLHDETYSTSPQFKNTSLFTHSPTIISNNINNITTTSTTLNLTPNKTNRSYTIKNMKAPSPSQQKTKLFQSNENVTTPIKNTSGGNQNTTLQHSPTSPSISPSSTTNKLDPSLIRIHYRTSMFTQTKPISITTGQLCTITQIHLRDALDNPVSTIATTSNPIGYGPILPIPLKIQCDGPINNNDTLFSSSSSLSSNIPIYCYVVGPAIIGVSFFPCQHGIYQISATIDGNPIKNSPLIFKSTNNNNNNNNNGTVSPNELKSIQTQQQQQTPNGNRSGGLTPSTSSTSLSNSTEKKRKLPLLDFESDDLLDFVESEFDNNLNNNDKKSKSNNSSKSNSLNTSINNIFDSNNNNNKNNNNLDNLINNVNKISNNDNDNNNDFDKKVCDFVDLYNKRFGSNSSDLIGNNSSGDINQDNTNNNNNNNEEKDEEKKEEKEEIIESTLLIGDDEISPTLQCDDQQQSSNTPISSLNKNSLNINEINSNNSIIINSNNNNNNYNNILNEEIEPTLPTN